MQCRQYRGLGCVSQWYCGGIVDKAPGGRLSFETILLFAA